MTLPTTGRRGRPTYVMTPDAMTFDAELSDGALRTFLALVAYARTAGGPVFEMTADQLGALVGRSADQVTRRTRELEARGYLEVDRRRGYHLPNRYTVLDPQGVLFSDRRGRTSAGSGTRTFAGSWDRTSAGSKYIGEERGREGNTLASSVDNVGATRPPDAYCDDHGGPAGRMSDGTPWCPGCRVRF